MRRQRQKTMTRQDFKRILAPPVLYNLKKLELFINLSYFEYIRFLPLHCFQGDLEFNSTGCYEAVIYNALPVLLLLSFTVKKIKFIDRGTNLIMEHPTIFYRAVAKYLKNFRFEYWIFFNTVKQTHTELLIP